MIKIDLNEWILSAVCRRLKEDPSGDSSVDFLRRQKVHPDKHIHYIKQAEYQVYIEPWEGRMENPRARKLRSV